MYRSLFDHLATRVDAETAHRAGFAAIRAGSRMLPRMQGRPVTAMGIEFPGVLGLAAGFDKNAVGIDALARVGFAFVEVGTVTAQAQPGNPRPRLFRLPPDRAIVNRMGFNNDGAAAVARRLARRTRNDVVVGVNIGKSKVTPEDRAVDDYRESARLLAPYADYLVVNVSSPNTPGLRDLQAVDKLQPILSAVRAEIGALPLLVKIAPDLADDDVLAVADLALAEDLAGVVATNTTISRDGLTQSTDETGGLSGRPLRARALEVTRLLRDRLGERPTIIGVGGISTPDDGRERLAAGADLLQAYTAFIYEGPLWPSRMNRALVEQRAPASASKPSVGTKES